MAIHSCILAWEIPWTGSPWAYKELDETERTHTHMCTQTHTCVHTPVSDVCLALGEIHGSEPWFPSLECNTNSA